METPYNENLLLSAGYGLNGLFGESQPVPPGRRNQVELGIQQGLGKWLVADFGYFNKRTDNGYDFGVLFNTPIAFPVAWDHSRIDGFTGRLNLVEHNGFSAFVVMAHTNAIYSPPGVGGILLEQPEGDFRIDHDQKFNATTNLQYVFEKRTGAWAALAWRYDSGLVAGAVASLDDALALTANQQTAIGFFCGDQFATRDTPLTSANCTASNYGATRLRIPAEGTADDVANPPTSGAAASLRSRHRRRQPAAHRQDQAPRPVQRDQPDQQGCALQLPVDVQRDALRDAACVSVAAWRDVLNDPVQRRHRRIGGCHSCGRR